MSNNQNNQNKQNTPPEFLTLSQAAARLESNGKRPSTCTLWRWARHGCRGVRLEYLRMGKQIYVTPEALTAFGAALAAVDRPLSPSKPYTSPYRSTIVSPRSAERRAREIGAAEDFLRAEGVIR